MKSRIEIEKQEALIAAKELCYGETTLDKIDQAVTVLEIDRILKQARLDIDAVAAMMDAYVAYKLNREAFE